MQYRLLCFDQNGKAFPPEDLMAEDDQTAIALVTLMLPKACELWRGNELIYAKPKKKST